MGPRVAERVLHRAAAADAVDHQLEPALDRGRADVRPVDLGAGAPGDLLRLGALRQRPHHLVGPELLAELELVVLDGEQGDVGAAPERAQRPERPEPDRASADHQHPVLVARQVLEHRVGADRERLDEDAVLVGERGRHPVELRDVGDELLAHPAGELAVVADQDPRREVALGGVLAAALEPAGAERARRRDPPEPAREQRVHRHPLPELEALDPGAELGDLRDHLVPEHRGEAVERLEDRAVLVEQRRQVAAAQPAQQRAQPHPAGPGQLRPLDVGAEREVAEVHPHRGLRKRAADRLRREVPRNRDVEHETLHEHHPLVVHPR